MENFYETLGIGEDASETHIKKTYHQLALKWHPDRNPGNAEAERMTKQINNAYDYLSDKVKRAAHDASLLKFREAQEEKAEQERQSEEAERQRKAQDAEDRKRRQRQQQQQPQRFPWGPVLGGLAAVILIVLLVGGGKK